MRFLTPPQTISEYRHNKFRVFETLGLSATTIAGLGLAAGAAGTVGSLIEGANRSQQSFPSAPNFSSVVPTQQTFLNAQNAELGLPFAQTQSNIFNTAATQGINFANQGTAANIANQNMVTPGSAGQREAALNQLNSYIQGNVPTDVQQNINRQVAQNLGGGFNLFSGGGQAPQNFARNIGQTSLGLSQFGLSAAPTWQQLANTMVVRPETGLQAGLSAQGLANSQVLGAAGLGNQQVLGTAQLGQNALENQYQAGVNQYGAQQEQSLGLQNTLTGLASAGTGLYNAGTMANYYGNLSPSGQGAANTLAANGFPSGLPSIFDAAGALGYNPTSFTPLKY